jgi:hypothetical protein
VSHLQQRFELAPRSYLAEEVVRRANEGLEHYEAEAGTRRLQPGELLIEHEGEKLPIPLLSPDWSRRLADGFSLSAVRRHLEYQQLQTLLQCDDSLTLEQLWQWTDQKELVRKRGGKEFLPSEPLNVEALQVSPRPMEDITLPDVVLEPITDYLARDHGCKPALARAMAEQAARIRQWCCPRIQEVRPGQAVWLVYSTLTHKTIVVEMSLDGMSTQQIARRIFHTPEAVDNYLRLFDRVLLLRYFRMPPNLMRQVTGHSLALINEHLALAKKHFPTESDLADYLINRGVDEYFGA